MLCAFAGHCADVPSGQRLLRTRLASDLITFLDTGSYFISLALYYYRAAIESRHYHSYFQSRKTEGTETT